LLVEVAALYFDIDQWLVSFSMVHSSTSIMLLRSPYYELALARLASALWYICEIWTA